MLFQLALVILLHSSGVIQWLPASDGQDLPTEYDFGDLPHDQPVEHIFQYKNSSDEPLVLDNVRPSCGCTAPDWSLEPIAPGAVGELKIKFNAKKPGYFRKKIRVFFNQLKRAEVLYIEGYVQEPLSKTKTKSALRSN